MAQSWTGILYMGTGPTGSTGSTGPTGQTGPTGLQGAFFSTLSVVDTANGTTLLTPTSFYLGAGGAVTDFSGIGSQEGLSLQTNGIYLQIGNAPLIPNGTTINIGLRDKNALYWLYAECVGGASTTSVQIRMNINNGSGNVAQGSPFTYTSNQILTFSLDGVNASFLLDGVVQLTIPYTTTQAPNPLGFFANGGATAVTYSQVLFYPTGPKGVTGSTGPTGPTGPQGQNGVTGGLTLFFDTAGGSISGAAPTPVSGTLPTVPVQTAQTTIVYSSNNSGAVTGVNVGSFITAVDQIVSPILGGLWSVNMYASTTETTMYYYANIYSVDADGTSNKTLIVSGSASPVIVGAQAVYTQDLYVPATTLVAGKRIIIDLFVNNTSGNNHVVTFEFRSTTLSHVHTTIIGNIATGPTGPTLPIQGAGTGSILLQNADDSNVYFSDSLQILNTGTTQYISVSGDILPTINAAFSIGSPTHRFNSLWLTGTTIYLGNSMISSDPSGNISTTNSDGHTTAVSTGPTGSTGNTGPTGPIPQFPSLTSNGYNTSTVSPTLTVDAFTLIMQDSTKLVQIKAVTGTLDMYWSGITTYWNNPTAAVYYSSGAGTVNVTTTYVNIDQNGSPIGIGSGGDTMVFTLQDTTNSKVYQVTATKTASSGCVFAVNRYV